MEKKTDLKIDAVAEVRRIRDAHHDRLADQPWDVQAAFFRDRAAELNRSLREAGKLTTRTSAA